MATVLLGKGHQISARSSVRGTYAAIRVFMITIFINAFPFFTDEVINDEMMIKVMM